MKIDILNLNEENLLYIPEENSYPFSCKYCLYWEFPQEFLSFKHAKKEVLLGKKINWLHNTIRLFGNCGLVAYIDGKIVGYAQYAPSKLLPASLSYQKQPDDDAIFISCLFIAKKQFQRAGIGSKLLLAIIDDLRKRKIKAIETFASKNSSNNPSGPIEFYLKNGFYSCKDDKDFSLMRLEI
jgi:GNAT superfamily N-acetyltransferase